MTLYVQRHIARFALAPPHRTHNIPGKFLSYMHAGLPVLASINPGNDLIALIKTERVGRVCADGVVDTLASMANELLGQLAHDDYIGARCRALSVRLFSPVTAALQIVEALRA